MPQPTDIRSTIRLKPDEHAMLKEKAGNKPFSTFLRELALEKAVGRRKANKATPIKDQKALAQIMALLGQHELVRAFKQTEQQVSDGIHPADDEALELLRECRDLLTRIHQLLMRALGVAER